MVEEIVRVVDIVPPAGSVRLVVLNVALTPVGETASVSFTVPVKPDRLVRETVAGLEVPLARVRLLGLAETVKSVMVTGMVREWVIEPLVATTVTV